MRTACALTITAFSRVSLNERHRLRRSCRIAAALLHTLVHAKSVQCKEWSTGRAPGLEPNTGRRLLEQGEFGSLVPTSCGSSRCSSAKTCVSVDSDGSAVLPILACQSILNTDTFCRCTSSGSCLRNWLFIESL